MDIFFITLCAVICGNDNWVVIEEFGKAKEEWFTKLLGLTHGIPSHDTFGDVFAASDTEQFSECFSSWVTDLADLTEGEIIVIDGKCLRLSLDSASKKAAIYMVSAWSQHNSLVLGQVKHSEETRYFVSSLNANDRNMLEHAVRAHWSIENNLHWVLDNAFDEDSNRARKGYSAANLAIIRRLALNLIKKEKTLKVGVKTKRLKAGWSNDYLLQIIGAI